ncbi:hypothetical protein GCM10011581_22610 [Saccharopolyspora subtropica]|uniref:Uncharacterized protein n=1 Tax=Saccharopolyspora thermophila TaxID=89367 RepID=A0A917NB71_9PSEU|nr:hypothetical protein GCM10011581_22610 [Saccharopolyspora subtropica]
MFGTRRGESSGRAARGGPPGPTEVLPPPVENGAVAAPSHPVRHTPRSPCRPVPRWSGDMGRPMLLYDVL